MPRQCRVTKVPRDTPTGVVSTAGIEGVAISETPYVAQRAAFYVVIVCWWLFALTFWLRKRPPGVQEAKRDRTSLVGLFLQAIAYFSVGFYPLQQRQFSPVTSGSRVLEWGLAVLTVAIALASVWLVNAAARRLGKQWALTARLVEGHALIQDGPYRFVRNPIYTGMFGMLLATGLAADRWQVLPLAVTVFVIGTVIRVRSEEK